MRTRCLLLSLGLAVAIALESTVVTAQGGAPSHEELARAAVQRVLGRGAPETVQVYGEWFAQKNTRTVTQSQNLRATVQRVLGRGTPETVQVYSEIAPKKTRTETQSPSLKRPGRPWTTACDSDLGGPSTTEPDGKVDVHDLLKSLSGYDKLPPEGLTFHPADSDKNGAVDVEDLLSVLKYYDRECKDHQRPAEGAGFFG